MDLMLRTCAQSLARMGGLPVPSYADCMRITNEAFNVCDADGSGTIDMNELEAWVHGNKDVMKFLVPRLCR